MCFVFCYYYRDAICLLVSLSFSEFFFMSFFSGLFFSIFRVQEKFDTIEKKIKKGKRSCSMCNM